jgi:thiamine-phosphate pyrophosphorylase
MYLNGICFITDSKHSSLPLQEIVGKVLRAGVRCIQYRAKDLSRRLIYENAVLLRELTVQFHANLIINDHADIAIAVDADGVHLGQDDFPLQDARKIMGTKIIGISTHDLLQAKEAESGGADYIGFGPVFNTDTKDAGSPKGLEGIRMIRQAVNLPVMAIGGISPDNLEAVINSGADAVAVSSAICKGDVVLNTERFIRYFVDNYSGRSSK